ncbi:hypothetical protein SAMN05216389_101225 [Oceanobacillus limi]|uniref:Uncharacterized protein n=1 Tax=Oceanobacillus limi TaxID=930131 RepID=A0A1H9Y6V3_9BACI|nr:CBO0543 family protein [Oceanobacillus limi]SES64492.1 hypothetical protein SAMN05216389_101225 [Oceanobacillus limi]
MSQDIIHYIILFSAITINGMGCMYILRKNVKRYGMIFFLSILAAIILCLLFYWMGFYRYVLPIQHVLPAVAISFSFLVLLVIRYRPRNNTFPFFFILTTSIFSIEVLLKDYVGFIHFRNGWDYWDSYSLYWVYARLFNHIGVYLVPFEFRNPVDHNKKMYWWLFYLLIVYFCVGVYVLHKGWDHFF